MHWQLEGVSGVVSKRHELWSTNSLKFYISQIDEEENPGCRSDHSLSPKSNWSRLVLGHIISTENFMKADQHLSD